MMIRLPSVTAGLSLAIVLFFAVVALLADILAPTALGDYQIADRLAAPSAEHLLGCDLFGADILTGLVYGARTSLIVALATVSLTLAVGIPLGLLAGLAGGWVDAVLMRIIDVLMAFPGILLAMAIAALLGPGLSNVILAIAATGWTASARLVRAQTLQIREFDYVTASRAAGARGGWIAIRHVLPGVVGPIVVNATFSLAGVIIVESSLSFLGLAGYNEAPSWGSLLSQGQSVLLEAPLLSIAPGVAIFLIVLAFNLLGDKLRDHLDPRLAAQR